MKTGSCCARALQKEYIEFVCGQAQVVREVGIICHGRGLESYPSMGVWYEGFALGDT